jgi:hypothetical protein
MFKLNTGEEEIDQFNKIHSMQLLEGVLQKLRKQGWDP